MMGVESRPSGEEERGEGERAGKHFRVGTSGDGRVWILSSLFFRRVHLVCKSKQTFIISTSPLEPAQEKETPLTSSRSRANRPTPNGAFVAPLAETPQSLTRHRNFSHAPMSWKAWEGATHQLAVATAHLTAGSTSGGELECRLGDEPPVLEELVAWTRNAQAGEEPCRGLGKLLRHTLAQPSKTRNGTTRTRSAAVSALCRR